MFYTNREHGLNLASILARMLMKNKILAGFFLIAVSCALAAITRADVFNMPPGGQKSLEFVTVGDPGNVADTVLSGDGTTLFGAVSYTYRMGKYDVTCAQYAQFLNAVARSSDPYGLYDANMQFVATGSPTATGCGIVRSASTPYTYSVIAGCDNFPVNYVNWGDAARFANWLQNGQPVGAEGPGTTETGAYTLNGATSSTDLHYVNRNPGAGYFLPTENEWYKAAYYKGGGANAGYWLYPTRSDLTPSNAPSSAGTNNANFRVGTFYTDLRNFLTPVGLFAASPRPYSTYDQGGNVFQLNETKFALVSGAFADCGVRGGSFNTLASGLTSAQQYEIDVATDASDVGFRIGAAVGEPSSFALLLLAAGGVLVRLVIARWRGSAAGGSIRANRQSAERLPHVLPFGSAGPTSPALASGRRSDRRGFRCRRRGGSCCRECHIGGVLRGNIRSSSSPAVAQ